MGQEADGSRGKAAPAEGRGFSVYDHIRTPASRRRLRSLPAIVAGTVRLLWEAGPRDLLVSAVAQLATGLGIVLQLLVARQVLGAVLGADPGEGIDQVAPELTALALLTAVLAVANVVQTEMALRLGERVTRLAAERVLDVAVAVDLEAFEDPEFHDRFELARFNAGARPLLAVRGLLGAASALIGTVAVLVTLLAVVPLVLPLVVLGAVPMALASTRNSRDYHAFTVRMIPRDRIRNYLHNALSSKDLAKDVRSFDLVAGAAPAPRHAVGRAAGVDAGHERHPPAPQPARRRRQRRAHVRRPRAPRRTDDRRAPRRRPTRGSAVVGLIYLGGRVSAMVTGTASLFEAALFIDDVESFLELKPPVRTFDPAPPSFDRLAVEGVDFTYPGARPPALTRHRRSSCDGARWWPSSARTARARPRWPSSWPACYVPDGRVDPVGRRGRDRTSTPPRFATAVAVLFQDFARYHLTASENVGLGRRRARRRRRGHPRRPPGRRAPTPSSSRLPAGYETLLSRLFSRRPATSRSASGSGWPWPGPSSATRRSSSWTSPPPPLDPLAEHELFERHAGAGRRTGPCCSSPTASRASATPTASTCCATGPVVESGSHDELMAEDGHYARMFSLQARPYREVEDLR